MEEKEVKKPSTKKVQQKRLQLNLKKQKVL